MLLDLFVLFGVVVVCLVVDVLVLIEGSDVMVMYCVVVMFVGYDDVCIFDLLWCVVVLLFV